MGNRVLAAIPGDKITGVQVSDGGSDAGRADLLVVAARRPG